MATSSPSCASRTSRGSALCASEMEYVDFATEIRKYGKARALSTSPRTPPRPRRSPAGSPSRIPLRSLERGSMILTSNQGFGSWGDVFGDRVIATAILDRILHHAITINIRGNSYRLKDKLKAGLVRPAEATEST